MNNISVVMVAFLKIIQFNIILFSSRFIKWSLTKVSERRNLLHMKNVRKMKTYFDIARVCLLAILINNIRNLHYSCLSKYMQAVVSFDNCKIRCHGHTFF